MNYIDGFISRPVPNAKRDAYQRHAEDAAVVFRDHGALGIVECWGDDVPEGKLTSFTMAVKREPEESVVFSWVTWPSKEMRDAGWKATHGGPAHRKMDPPACPSTASA